MIAGRPSAVCAVDGLGALVVSQARQRPASTCLGCLLSSSLPALDEIALRLKPRPQRQPDDQGLRHVRALAGRFEAARQIPIQKIAAQELVGHYV